MIKVIEANKFHMPYYKNVVSRIHALAHNDKFSSIELNDYYLSKLYTTVLLGAGTCLIAVDDNQPIGIAMGIIGPNIWSIETMFLNQILLYVEESHRNTRAGYYLIKEYTDKAQEMIENNKVRYATVSASQPMFELDFSRFGYDMGEKLWILGE